MCSSRSPEAGSPSQVPPCVICAYPSNGYNFGVLSCRACSAFFRRARLQKAKYTCKTGLSRCEIGKKERFFCKSCRFNRCLKAGMDPEKFQTNRDLLSSTVSRFKISRESSPLYDFFGLMNELNEIFADMSMINASYTSLTGLEKMEQALNSVRGPHGKELKMNDSMDMRTLIQNRVSEIKQCARWYMFSPIFQGFSNFDKLMMVKTTWIVWSRIEKLSMSVDIFGEKTRRDKIVVASSTEAVNLNSTLRNILKEMNHGDKQAIDQAIEYLLSAIFDTVAEKLLTLKPTPRELSFILCHVGWCVSSKTQTGKVLRECERSIEVISTELHNYYINDLKIEKYAVRILKMMSVLKLLQKTYIDYHKVMTEVEKLRKSNIFSIQ